MDAGLTCCICGEVLKNPKQLPCGHPTCRLCLQDYFLNHLDPELLTCPKCGSPLPAPDPERPLVQWVDSFPVDLSAAKKIDNMQWIYGATVKEKCVICLKKFQALTATKYCKTCQEYYCDECGNDHWLQKAIKPHRVTLVEDMENLKNDPLLRAEMTAVFSARINCGRTKSPRNADRSKSNSPRIDRLTPRGHSPEYGLLSPGNAPSRSSPSSPGSRSKSPLGNLLSPHPPREKSPSAGIDTEDCIIIAMTFLPDGCIVLSDEGNCKLKLFDKNYRFLSSTDACCWNLINLNSYLLAGTSPKENNVIFFCVYDDVIQTESSVDLEQPCYGLCKFDYDGVAVACSGAKTTVNILNRANKTEVTSISLEKGKLTLRKPENLCRHDNLYYVSDSESRCLKCVSDDGCIIWERTLDDIKGLAIYGSFILVGRSDQQTVDILSTDGRCLKSVVGAEDGLSTVTAIAAEPAGTTEDISDRLAVTDNSGLVRVFSLMDPNREDEVHGETTEIRNTDAKPKARKSKLCSIV